MTDYVSSCRPKFDEQIKCLMEKGKERVDMSELDGASPQEMAAFEREFIDTHTEIKVRSALENMNRGAYNGGSSVKVNPSDKGITRRHKIPGKNLIEAECMEEQRGKVLNCLGKAFEIRQKEILNKHDFSIKDLINAMARLMPQQVDSKVETTHNFAEEIKRLTLEKKTYKAIDAEDAD